MNKKLWCDLKTDQEKAEFLRSGRAWDTGIIAEAIVEEVAEAFQFRADNSVVSDINSNFNKDRLYSGNK